MLSRLLRGKFATYRFTYTACHSEIKTLDLARKETKFFIVYRKEYFGQKCSAFKYRTHGASLLCGRSKFIEFIEKWWVGILVVGLSREIVLKENSSCLASHCQVTQGIRITKSPRDEAHARYFIPRHPVCTGTKLHTCIQSVTHTHVMPYAHG